MVDITVTSRSFMVLRYLLTNMDPATANYAQITERIRGRIKQEAKNRIEEVTLKLKRVRKEGEEGAKLGHVLSKLQWVAGGCRLLMGQSRFVDLGEFPRFLALNRDRISDHYDNNFSDLDSFVDDERAREGWEEEAREEREKKDGEYMSNVLPLCEEQGVVRAVARCEREDLPTVPGFGRFSDPDTGEVTTTALVGYPTLVS
ncbi:unknown protein [Seminavis robusta]|uniref:Uncharacterized protein n=1 Tax=Seminavis robusta TaxID=568900 RepID=A0A9N8E7C2_9STRA|nr:unknown protein [Seminavis robusta]|eukprot:Sro698_g189340.1 n/a (202) ;mRNA; r:47902-48507